MTLLIWQWQQHYVLIMSVYRKKHSPASWCGIMEAILRRDIDMEIHRGIWTHKTALALNGWQFSRMMSSFHIFLAWIIRMLCNFKKLQSYRLKIYKWTSVQGKFFYFPWIFIIKKTPYILVCDRLVHQLVAHYAAWSLPSLRFWDVSGPLHSKFSLVYL